VGATRAGNGAMTDDGPGMSRATQLLRELREQLGAYSVMAEFHLDEGIVAIVVDDTGLHVLTAGIRT